MLTGLLCPPLQAEWRVQYLEGCVKEWKRQNKQLRLVVEEQAMCTVRTDGDTGGCFCGDLLAFAVQAEQLEEGLSDKEVPHAIALRHQTCCLFNLHMLPRQVAIAAVTARLHGKEVCLFRKVYSTGHDPRGGRLS